MDNAKLLLEKLSDKYRRLTSGLVYNIMDKRGNIVPFIPNKTQLRFIHAKMKYPNIVAPKARQRGISTVEDLWDFDDVLFSRNVTCGIIADTKDIAQKIFKQKVMIFWNYLAPWVKYQNGISGRTNRTIDTSTTNELSFSNTGSSISVGTSYRGGTLQNLHVSEYGKICAKYPNKAEEIKTGAFETLARGQNRVVESTAMGAYGHFYELCLGAKAIQDEGREPNDMEWFLFFVPWYEEDEYRSDANVQLTPDEISYFVKLKGMGIKLDIQQMKWYALKKRGLKQKMFQEYPSTFEEAFMLITEGSYYEKELDLAIAQQRVDILHYDPNLLVHTAWDLGGAGGGDQTSIRFFQTYGNKIHVIDYREGNNRSFRWILNNIIKLKKYNYGNFYGPHDMKVTEYSDGKTRRAVADEEGFVFDIIDLLPISDGIDMVRDIFPRVWFDKLKCSLGLSRLATYQKKMDEKYNTPVGTPLKNGSQHGADAFRYLATAVSGGHTTRPDATITGHNYKDELS